MVLMQVRTLSYFQMKKDKVITELNAVIKAAYIEQISLMITEDDVKDFILKRIKSSPDYVSHLREAIESVTKFSHLAKLINLQ